MNSTEAKTRSRPAVLRDAAFTGTLLLVPPWCVGQSARDAWWLTGLCFYVPSAFLAVALLTFGVLYAAARRRRVALLAAVLALPPLGFVLFVENHFIRPQPPAASASLRLVHWNVGGALHRQGMRDVLAGLRADLYVLAEVPNPQSVEDLRDALGEGYEARVFGTMAAVGRTRVAARGWLLDRGRARVQAVGWEHDGHALAVLGVDLPSSIWVARDPLLREVNGLIGQHQPDLVVGDFNAPRRSRALGELPPGYAHAYESAGGGLGYTWPVPVPMYALDHCLHGRRVVPARYDLVSSVHSDHRGQVFDFSLAP